MGPSELGGAQTSPLGTPPGRGVPCPTRCRWLLTPTAVHLQLARPDTGGGRTANNRNVGCVPVQGAQLCGAGGQRGQTCMCPSRLGGGGALSRRRTAQSSRRSSSWAPPRMRPNTSRREPSTGGPALVGVSAVLLVKKAPRTWCTAAQLLRVQGLNRDDLEVEGRVLHCHPLPFPGPWECEREGVTDPAPLGHVLRLRWRARRMMRTKPWVEPTRGRGAGCAPTPLTATRFLLHDNGGSGDHGQSMSSPWEEKPEGLGVCQRARLPPRVCCPL